MKIKGMQKLTLLDYPGKVACSLFLFGCNFRCGFCHNPELIEDRYSKLEEYSQEEVLEFLKKRKKYLDGICITGGEPLMTIEKGFLRKIKEMGYLIKIDTNGAFPEKLKELIEEKLIDYIAMDIKSSKEKYKSVINKEIDIEDIEKSIRIVSNLENYEFRTTVLPLFHNVDDIIKIKNWILHISGKPRLKKFCIQQFIPRKGGMLDRNFEAEENYPKEILEEMKEFVKDSFEECEVRNV